jgi:hypothetical protein
MSLWPWGVESCARLNPILVDYMQWPEAHVLRIVVVCEREAVETIKPAVVLMTARFSRANGN